MQYGYIKNTFNHIRKHFINVGHGDCIVVEFVDSGRVAVIDINMTDDMDDTTKNEC